MNYSLIFTLTGICFGISLLCAHNPDFSSLMIYEQKGKNFLIIKSSITAFEGEVNYHFGKSTYKTAKDFKDITVKYFSRNCLIIINQDTVHFLNPQVQLGHETTLFTELEKVPPKINTLRIKNLLFKDFPNHQCELILMLKDLPKNQFILKSENQYSATFNIIKGKWFLEENSEAMLRIKIYSKYLVLGGFILLIFLVWRYSYRS